MAIRWDKLTVKAQEAVQRANDLASEHGNPELQPVHILAALLEDHEGIVAPLLERVGLPVSAVQTQAMERINQLPKVSGGGAAQATLSSAGNQLLENAFKEAANFKDEFVSTEHLLLAMTNLNRDPAHEILARAGATYESVSRGLTPVRGNEKVPDQAPEVKYFVCYARSPKQLQDVVNQAIQNGWQPFGGVSVSMSVKWLSGQYSTVAEEQVELWCQAVVRGIADRTQQSNRDTTENS